MSIQTPSEPNTCFCSYFDRIKYLKGVGLVNTKQINEGKKLLKELIDDSGVPAYLKGLARTELSTIELKNRI